jgi:hypothetical protein
MKEERFFGHFVPSFVALVGVTERIRYTRENYISKNYQ